jgi:hypothetical protein
LLLLAIVLLVQIKCEVVSLRERMERLHAPDMGAPAGARVYGDQPDGSVVSRPDVPIPGMNGYYLRPDGTMVFHADEWKPILDEAGLAIGMEWTGPQSGTVAVVDSYWAQPPWQTLEGWSSSTPAVTIEKREEQR